MSLRVFVQGEHFIVTDGCKLDDVESNVVNNEEFKAGDDLCREGSLGPASNYLFFRNISLLKLLYQSGYEVDLHCPVCNKTYTLGQKEFEIGMKKLRELTGE